MEVENPDPCSCVVDSFLYQFILLYIDYIFTQKNLAFFFIDYLVFIKGDFGQVGFPEGFPHSALEPHRVLSNPPQKNDVAKLFLEGCVTDMYVFLISCKDLLKLYQKQNKDVVLFSVVFILESVQLNFFLLREQKGTWCLNNNNKTETATSILHRVSSICRYCARLFTCVTSFYFHKQAEPIIILTLFIHFFRISFIYFQRGAKGRRKRGGETSMCGCLSCTLHWGPGPQHRHVP